MKTSKENSDAYMAGWGARHKQAGSLFSNPHEPGELFDYWNEGWLDCDSGVIDSAKALGPSFIEPKPRKEN